MTQNATPAGLPAIPQSPISQTPQPPDLPAPAAAPPADPPAPPATLAPIPGAPPPDGVADASPPAANDPVDPSDGEPAASHPEWGKLAPRPSAAAPPDLGPSAASVAPRLAGRTAAAPRAVVQDEGRISADQYNALWRAWVERQSMAYAAEAVGIAVSTAKTYIDGDGDPVRGMEPIRKRWLRVQARSQAEEEQGILEYRRKQMKLVTRALDTVGAELELARADVVDRVKALRAATEKGEAGPKASQSLEKLTSSIDRMVRLGERMLGGPDVVSERRDRPAFDTWTVEELVEYSTTGRVPMHATTIEAKGDHTD